VRRIQGLPAVILLVALAFAAWWLIFGRHVGAVELEERVHKVAAAAVVDKLSSGYGQGRIVEGTTEILEPKGPATHGAFAGESYEARGLMRVDVGVQVLRVRYTTLVLVDGGDVVPIESTVNLSGTE